MTSTGPTPAANGEVKEAKKRGRPPGSKTTATHKSGGATPPNSPYWTSNEGKRALQHIKAIVDNAKHLENLLSGAMNANGNAGNMLQQYPFYSLPPFGPMGFMDPMSYGLNAGNVTGHDLSEVETHPEEGKKPKGEISKRKRVTKPKDPDAPKQPLSSYMLYMLDNTAAFKRIADGSTERRQIGTVAGEEWRKLTPEQRKPYEDRSAQLRVEYNKTMEAYKAKKAAVEAGTDVAAVHDETEDDETSEEVPKKRVVAMDVDEEEEDDEEEDEDIEEEELQPPPVKKFVPQSNGSSNFKKKAVVHMESPPVESDNDEDDETDDDDEVVIQPAKKFKPAASVVTPSASKSSPMGPPSSKVNTAATSSGTNSGKPVAVTGLKKEKSKSVSTGSPPLSGTQKKMASDDGKKKRKTKE